MKKRTMNSYDDLLGRAYNEVIAARARLRGEVQDVITKKGVIDLYPDGADKNTAIQALKDAQYSLLCAIGNYDARVSEAKECYTMNYEKCNQEWADANFLTSHKIIENEYRYYFKS